MTEKVQFTGIPSVANALAGIGLRSPLSDIERQLLKQLQSAPLPHHIAVIMDGNGRWAKRAGFAERVRGHEAGADTVRRVVRACGELNIHVLTLYAFSVENWKRPKSEVHFLMKMFEKFLKNEIDELNAGNVRLRAAGCLSDLPASVRGALDNAIAATAGNTGLILNLAISYGARTEITQAVREIAAKVSAGELSPDEIDEQTIADSLYTRGLPDPDLLIRTSGELRVSNFLLWQIAYTELWITPVLWPDFTRENLYEALVEYARRDRRFGGLK
ncbi:isoprenyl transferase [Candidatus Sumerlaeota bacterium]|nr:isoprenyl transferase [Candidatus Sumerlaeota bacterium]